MILGSVAAIPFLKRAGQFEAVVLLVGLCLFSGGIILASWTVSSGLLLTALALGFAFAGEGIAKPVSLTLLQKRIAPEFLGRVMALEQGLSAVVQDASDTWHCRLSGCSDPNSRCFGCSWALRRSAVGRAPDACSDAK